jgi:hypothetical protein
VASSGGSRRVGAHTADPWLLREIEASLDRIVQINQREAAIDVAGILAAFHQDYAIDALGGTLAILLTFVVGAALLRSIRRQRALLVSDNGVGMDEATTAHAFDPLFRGRATSRAPGPGWASRSSSAPSTCSVASARSTRSPVRGRGSWSGCLRPRRGPRARCGARCGAPLYAG